MTTYAELVQQLQDITEDDSTEFVADIPNQIKAAENRIFRYVQDLPVFRTTDTGTLSSGTNTLAKPTGYKRARSLRITVSSAEVFLEKRTDQYIYDYAPDSTATAQPKFFADNDEVNLLLGPTPDANYPYTLDFIRQPDGLSVSNSSNWVSENCENALLYGCLREAALFLEYPEQAGDWDAKFQEEIGLLKEELLRTYKIDYGV